MNEGVWGILLGRWRGVGVCWALFGWIGVGEEIFWVGGGGWD